MSRRITFKGIVSDKDNWQRYQAAYEGQVTLHQIAEVEKMLGCGDAENGFATYICLHCGEEKRVAFSCKSRVCSSCGKVHADEWSRHLVGRLFNVTHRHMTFTLPDKLWPILEAHPSWRKVLFPSANEALRKAIRGIPGIAIVMHPYGKDLKVNYRLHVLVTEGGLDEPGRWREQTFINYQTLRKVWQYEVLTQLRQVMRAEGESAALIDQMFDQYQEGFYVHAEPRVKQGAGISRCIGRYIRHPAIADSRIIGYDGANSTSSGLAGADTAGLSARPAALPSVWRTRDGTLQPDRTLAWSLGDHRWLEVVIGSWGGRASTVTAVAGRTDAGGDAT